MDNTCERNMQGTDDCLQDRHYIKLFAEQLTRIFEVFDFLDGSLIATSVDEGQRL